MWYQLQIEQCHQDEIDQLSDALEATGALSITLMDKNDNPVLEPAPGETPLWPEVVVTALYDDEPLACQAKVQLAQQYAQLQFSLHTMADQDWERAWMDDFKPQLFGKRFWICPSWLTPPDPDAVTLILDPGLAFGTGTHPTTHLCLEWLDQATLQNQSVIDYGCGSGILALAALKLGAANVQAVDIDPQAILATQNNADSNSLSQHLTIGFPDILTPPVDVVLANILLAPLITLQQDFRSFLKPEGKLVVSGILSDQAAALIEAYQPLFIHHESHDLEGWSLLVFTCRQ